MYNYEEDTYKIRGVLIWTCNDYGSCLYDIMVYINGINII